VFNPETEGEFENKWHQALACIERDFPSSLQTFVFHLLHHLPTYVKQDDGKSLSMQAKAWCHLFSNSPSVSGLNTGEK
jgi:hypothetical protein